MNRREVLTSALVGTCGINFIYNMKSIAADPPKDDLSISLVEDFKLWCTDQYKAYKSIAAKVGNYKFIDLPVNANLYDTIIESLDDFIIGRIVSADISFDVDEPAKGKVKLDNLSQTFNLMFGTNRKTLKFYIPGGGSPERLAALASFLLNQVADDVRQVGPRGKLICHQPCLYINREAYTGRMFAWCTYAVKK